MFLPYFVDKATVSAARENLDVKFFEFFGFAGDRRQLGRSNEGEITGIEAKEYPLSSEIG